jgi:hypothetical protein
MSTDKPQKKDWNKRNWVAKHAHKYNKPMVQEPKTKTKRKPKHSLPVHEIDPENYEEWDIEGY